MLKKGNDKEKERKNSKRNESYTEVNNYKSEISIRQ